MRIPLVDLEKTDWPSALRSITQEKIPTSIERKATSAIKKDMQRRIQAKADEQRRWKRARRDSQAAMRRVLVGEQDVQEIKQLLHASVEETRALEFAEPRAEQAEPSVYIGSFSTTVVPPYGFQWGIQKPLLGPVYLDTNESKATGTTFGNVVCTDDAGSFGIAISAVGSYLEPVVDTIMQFSSTPVLGYGWLTECFLADARSRGLVGLVVYQFDKGTTGTGDPLADPTVAYVEQELWNNESWGSGAGRHDGMTSTKLSTTFKASRGHWYSLYVFSWVQAYTDGIAETYYSAAWSLMGGTVPSMTWKCI